MGWAARENKRRKAEVERANRIAAEETSRTMAIAHHQGLVPPFDSTMPQKSFDSETAEVKKTFATPPDIITPQNKTTLLVGQRRSPIEFALLLALTTPLTPNKR